MQEIGKYLVMAGLIITVMGLIIWLFAGKFTWFGNLPGDIKIEREHFRFYFPLVSMLLISIIISLLIWAFTKVFR